MSHENREHQSDTRERGGAKKADKICFRDAHQRLDDEDDDRRECQAQHGRNDRAGQNAGRQPPDQ
jgi:hypothetical protein